MAAAEFEEAREAGGVPDFAGLPLSGLTDTRDPLLARAIRIARSRRAAAGIVYAGFHGGSSMPGTGAGAEDDASAANC